MSLDYEIKSIDTEKSKIPLRKCMKDGVIARFPSSVCFSGRSGSGKTCLLMNMLTNDKLLKNYFHYILVFSPTANSYDDTYKVLNLPDENFIPDFGKEELDNLIEKRKALIDEKGIEWCAKHSRVCIILDDVVANRDFLQSQVALKLFCLLRHYLCSIFILVQSYTKLPRALRLNCNSTYIFPCNQSEIEVLLDEVTPAEMTKKDFLKVISYCTQGDFDFMSINNHAKRGQRIRKNLNEVLDLETFKTKK
jgi:Cdc6-like AAA superfamily ATPase